MSDWWIADRDRCRVCRSDVAAGAARRPAARRPAMNGSEIIGLVLSVGLLVYLAIALLKPEWFA